MKKIIELLKLNIETLKSINLSTFLPVFYIDLTIYTCNVVYNFKYCAYKLKATNINREI